jgi:hypothetical protein
MGSLYIKNRTQTSFRLLNLILGGVMRPNNRLPGVVVANFSLLLVVPETFLGASIENWPHKRIKISG